MDWKRKHMWSYCGDDSVGQIIVYLNAEDNIGELIDRTNNWTEAKAICEAHNAALRAARNDGIEAAAKVSDEEAGVWEQFLITAKSANINDAVNRYEAKIESCDEISRRVRLLKEPTDGTQETT